jgi:hypothetical protein
MAFTEYHVTVAGAGAHNGTSKANAWTFAEMIAAAPAAESRINVYGDGGGYSEGLTTLPTNGTGTSPIVLRGCYATPGDLDDLGRGSDGLLNVTGFPVFTLSALWTPSAWCILQNLSIAGAISSYLLGSLATDNFGCVKCKFLNSQNNAAAGCVQGDNTVSLLNCDFSCTGASHAAVVDADVTIQVVGCTFIGTLDSAPLLSVNDLTLMRSVFRGTGGTIVAVKILSGVGPFVLIGNTIYNCGTAIEFPNSAKSSNLAAIVIDNHVTDCGKFLDNLYAATDDMPVIESNNRLRDVTTPRTGILSISLNSQVTTDDGDYSTDYVSATNLRLLATAAGAKMGMMPYSDIGAYGHADPAGGSPLLINGGLLSTR